ncbi:unnamed protein product [Protopolystoma xenopodis]|uniref:Uncharacterized protein n=1 Tax=Protopolystoma xenopodis TaxID=117903 RepID=A0A448XRG1_9PLAT|nr:unnamed protein product [Protopolystoma xenopodis]
MSPSFTGFHCPVKTKYSSPSVRLCFAVGEIRLDAPYGLNQPGQRSHLPHIALPTM